VHPEDHKRVMAESAHCDETGEPWDAVYRVVARDGHTVWVRSRSQMVSESDGRRVWQGVTVDITEEMQHLADLTVEQDTTPAEHSPLGP
jgi:PAS domain S-box-containing protein